MNRLWTWVVAIAVFVALGGAGTAIFALEQPTGTVEGQVLSKSKLPLVHAKVTAIGPVRRTVETDANGHFRIDRIRVGSYQMSAVLRGYEQQWQGKPVIVQEAKTTGDIRFALTPTQPTLNFSQYQRVFLPTEPLRIAYRGTLVDSLRAELSRTTIDTVLHAPAHAGKPRFGEHDGETHLETWEQPIPPGTGESDFWVYRQIELKKLPEGAYRLRVQGNGTFEGHPVQTDIQEVWFTVTHVGLIAKRTPEQLLLYTVDLVTKQPLAGVAVEGGMPDGNRQALGVSGKDGLLSLANSTTARSLVGKHGSGTAFMRLGIIERRHPETGYVYTDRPIYRPEQTVHLKAVLRDRVGNGYQIPAGRAVSVTIDDAAGEKVYSRSLTTSSMGAIDDDFTLGPTPSLGEYTVSVKMGGVSVDQTFQVKAYRKPEFRVDITPAKRQLILGEPVKATVSATYYFGAPVAGQQVRYTVYRSKTYPWMTDDDWFYSNYTGDESAEYSWGYGDVVTSGEGTTDEAGHLSVTAETKEAEPRKPYEATSEYRYTVEVETTDQTHRAVTTRESVIVAPSQLRLSADPIRYVVAPGESLEVGLTAKTLEDKPAAIAGTARLFRVVPQPPKNKENDETPAEPTYEPVEKAGFQTDAHGLGRVTFKAPAAGDYLVLAEAADAGRRATVASTSVWVSTEGGDGSSYRYGAMQIVFDKKRYKAGDTAIVFITRPKPGLPVLLTIEGERLHEARVLQGPGPSVTVKLPVKADYSPNAYISAVVVDGKEFHHAQRSLNVMPTDAFLTVNVTPDQQRYKPGDTARLTVSTKDAKGRGVPAEVSVGVVDQAIYALAPDLTADPRMVFHGPRANAVTTAYSFSEEYSGGADKDPANPRIRKRFLDTAAWFPAIRTDGDGKALVSFALPDNLTTWVLTARAHTAATQVGGSRTSFLATQDLLVRLATPRFMVEGDKLTLIGLIHNYLPSQTTVRTTLAVLGLAVSGSTDARVTIDPNGVAKRTYDLAAETAGTGALTLKAAGDQAGDALEQAFPILPHGTPDVAVMAGTSTGKTDLAITVPQEAVAGTASLAVELTPTPLGAVAGALSYLRDYPYGCTEQTLSRFVPELVAGPLVDSHVDAKLLQQGMQRIASLQHTDGGWGWWANDDSNPTLTAYVLLALKEAQTAGLSVPEPMAGNGAKYLVRQWPNLGFDKITTHMIELGAGPDEQALVLHALSRWGQARNDGLQRLRRDPKGLSPEGLANLAMAFGYAGDPGTARSLIGDLDRLAISSEAISHWEPKGASPWFDNAVEATSTVVQAMVLVQPDSPRIDMAVRYLLNQRRGRHWLSTKDTAATVLALAAVSRRDGSQPETMPVTLTMDGKTLAQTDLAEAKSWKQGYRLDVGASQLPAGKHTFSILRSDSDARPLPYSLERSVIVRAQHLDAVPGKELSITRTYRKLTAAVQEAKKGSNYGFWFNPKKAADLPVVSGKLVPGDLVLVELTVDNARPHAFVMLEDPLPSGMEVVPDRGEDAPWMYWWSHMEVRDDKVAIFMRHLPAGKHQAYYVLRPEIPGTVQALPPVVSEMYAPDVRARDAETRLTVSE